MQCGKMPPKHESISTALRPADLRKPATRFAEIRWTRGKLPDSSACRLKFCLNFRGWLGCLSWKKTKSVVVSWSEWQDLNLRPQRPEPGYRAI